MPAGGCFLGVGGTRLVHKPATSLPGSGPRCRPAGNSSHAAQVNKRWTGNYKRKQMHHDPDGDLTGRVRKDFPYSSTFKLRPHNSCQCPGPTKWNINAHYHPTSQGTFHTQRRRDFVLLLYSHANASSNLVTEAWERAGLSLVACLHYNVYLIPVTYSLQSLQEAGAGMRDLARKPGHKITRYIVFFRP